jgi:hypothetical protein
MLGLGVSGVLSWALDAAVKWAVVSLLIKLGADDGRASDKDAVYCWVSPSLDEFLLPLNRWPG